MGFRQPVRRSTLADDQRKARLAYPCGVGPAAHHPGATLYVDEELGLDLTNTVYALDHDHRSCLSVFPWAHFRTTKAAVKMRVDLRGNIPSRSSSRMAAARRSALDMHLPEAAPSIVDRGYVDRPPMCCTKPGRLRHACHEHRWHRVIRRRRTLDRHLATRPWPWTTAEDYHFLRAAAPSPARRWSSSPTTSRNGSVPPSRSTKAAGRWNSFKWIKQHLRSSRHVGERGEDALCRQSSASNVAIVKKRRLTPRSDTTSRSTLFGPAHTSSLAGDENRCNASQMTNQLNHSIFNREVDTLGITEYRRARA